jgi:hypothetical protein
MKIPRLEDMNNERFLKDAFDPETNRRLTRAVRSRRNIYLWFFLTGIACIFITAFTLQMHMSILALFLSTMSLVVMTKYDTQLHFLIEIRNRIECPMQDAEEEAG